MKELKFRYTCKRDNGHTFSETFTIEQIEQGDAKRWIDGNFVGMFNLKRDQYTGRKLKSGEEVYDGDLIQSFGDNPHEIYWDDRTASFRGRVNGEMQFDKTMPIDMMLYKGKMVGNIYENPELSRGNQSKN